MHTLAVALALLPLLVGAVPWPVRDQGFGPSEGLSTADSFRGGPGRDTNKAQQVDLDVASSKPLASRVHSMLLQLSDLRTGGTRHLKDILSQQLLKISDHVVPAQLLGFDPRADPVQMVIIEQAPEVVVTPSNFLWVWIVAPFVYVASVCAVAYFYFRQKPVRERCMPEPEDWETLKDWKYGVFDCCSAPEISLWSCCCPMIRWADTLSMAGLMGFWIAFVIYFAIYLLGSVAGPAEGVIHILLALICAGFRQEMRIKFRMERQGGMTYVEDCLLFCCCSFCMIVQEARQVEEACAVGEPVAVAQAVPVEAGTPAVDC